MASLEPRCIGTPDASMFPAQIRTRGSETGWFPRSTNQGFLNQVPSFEIFWFVNEAGPALLGQHIMDVQNSSTLEPLLRLSFTTASSQFSTLTWDWRDRANIQGFTLPVTIPNSVIPGVWWHSIIQTWPPGTGGLWNVHHGRTAVNSNNTLNPSPDSMPYPFSGSTDVGPQSVNPNHPFWLMGFRFWTFGGPPVEYRIGFGGKLNTLGTDFTAGSALNGGFAEARMWTFSYDPEPIPGNPPTPSEWERRRNIYQRHNNNSPTEDEGSSSETTSSLMHCWRFNETQGTVPEDYADTGSSGESEFDNDSSVTSGGTSTSPIQTPVGGVAVVMVPDGVGSIAASSEGAAPDLRIDFKLEVVTDLSESSEADVFLRKVIVPDLVNSLSSSAEGTPPDARVARQLGVVTDLAASSDGAEPDLLKALRFGPLADTALADEGAIDFHKAFALTVVTDDAVSTDLTPTLLVAGIEILESPGGPRRGERRNSGYARGACPRGSV